MVMNLVHIKLNCYVANVSYLSCTSMDNCTIEEFKSKGTNILKFLSNLDQIKVPRLHPSISREDLVSRIGYCILEYMVSII